MKTTSTDRAAAAAIVTLALAALPCGSTGCGVEQDADPGAAQQNAALAASSFCGPPAIDHALERALFVYKDCTAGTWHLVGTAGGLSGSYTGRVVSDQAFTMMQGVRLETNDTAVLSTTTTIDFQLAMTGAWWDQLDFDVPDGASVRLEVTDSAGAPLLAGASEISVTSPVVLSAASPTLDPAGCTALTNARLQALGYEPVRAHGAKGDGVTDDTVAIKAAIKAANDKRRVVYLHQGTYLVSSTLELKQDISNTRSNDDMTRFGQMLLGSYCGTSKPTIRLKDGVAKETNEAVIAAEPYPVILMWRAVAGATGPDDSENGRDWNQVVRNVRIVVGKNPGAVGLRHNGAEGSANQGLTIDATGAFAGLYDHNGAGGYSYDIEIIGGKYGIYVQKGHEGANLLVGLKLSGQEQTPIVFGGYTPFGLVGFDIRHKTGRIISSLRDGVVLGELAVMSHDSSGHVFLVDGKIDVTDSTIEVLRNTSRAVYLKNVYVKGQTKVLVNEASSGELRVADPSVWQRIGELSYSGPFTSLYGEPGMLHRGVKSDETFYNNARYATSSTIVVSDTTPIPGDLLSRHRYKTALCNVEAANNTFVTDYGANPNDTVDDTKAIQAAIDDATTRGNRVFLPASAANATYGLQGSYTIRGTLRLALHTELCGVTRYSSVLDASSWRPSVDSPVIATSNDASSRTVAADFKVIVPSATGYRANGDNPIYDPHVYALLWQAGRGSVYRDVYYRRMLGDPGKMRAAVISGNGGGKWYGVTQHVGHVPPDVDPSDAGESRPYRDAAGNLLMSPAARQMLITGTQEPLTFYPYHCQHLTTPRGALLEINQASNVTIYGTKSEMGSVPDRMMAVVRANPAALVPVWAFIRSSDNVALIGHEGTSQAAEGRGLIEVTGSANVTIASTGRRGNGLDLVPCAVAQDRWYFVKDDRSTGTQTLTAQGFVALYKNGL